jgi:hypothetical protein
MAIDKSIRQHYDNKYSVKNRRRYFTGAYGGAEAARGADPSSSGGDGHADRGWQTYVAPAPAPAPRPSPHVDSAANLMAEATRMENERKAKEAAIAKIIEQEVVIPHLGGADDGGWTRAFESPTNITGDTPEERREKEFLETGDYETLIAPDLGKRIDTAPKVDVKDIMGEVTDPGSVSYDPTYKTPEEIRTLQGTTDYGQFFRQPTVVEKPKSGIENLLKGALGLFAWPLASAILPSKLVTAAKFVKGAHDIKSGKYPKISTALDKLNFSNLTSTIGKGTRLRRRPKGMPEMLGERGFRTRDETSPDGPDIQRVVTGEEDLLTKGAKTLGLTDDQRKQYLLMQNKMKTALDLGYYTNQQGQVIQLNDQQLDQLQKYIDNLDNILGTVLQSAARGGRIDKALGGRSRDI